MAVRVSSAAQYGVPARFSFGRCELCPWTQWSNRTNFPRGFPVFLSAPMSGRSASTCRSGSRCGDRSDGRRDTTSSFALSQRRLSTTGVEIVVCSLRCDEIVVCSLFVDVMAAQCFIVDNVFNKLFMRSFIKEFLTVICPARCCLVLARGRSMSHQKEAFSKFRSTSSGRCRRRLQLRCVGRPFSERCQTRSMLPAISCGRHHVLPSAVPLEDIACRHVS